MMPSRYVLTLFSGSKPLLHLRSEKLRTDVYNALTDSALIALTAGLFMIPHLDLNLGKKAHLNLPVAAQRYDQNLDGKLDQSEAKDLFRTYNLDKKNKDQADLR